MKKRRRSTSINIYSILSVLAVLVVWQVVSWLGWIPSFMLPSPMQVVRSFINDFDLLVYHSRVTLIEATLGLLIGMLLGILIAIIMDHFESLRKVVHPLLVLTQTVPTVAIAPLLTIWFGFGIMPKVVLIVVTVFFPVSVAMLNGFSSVDPDEIRLLKSMGAGRMQIFRHIKIPASLNDFFSSLKIAVTYSVIGAVIAEWLGGFEGLGVYMTRVRKSYDFDKMFAVIFLISFISLMLMAIVNLSEKMAMPWKEE